MYGLWVHTLLEIHAHFFWINLIFFWGGGGMGDILELRLNQISMKLQYDESNHGPVFFFFHVI